MPTIESVRTDRSTSHQKTIPQSLRKTLRALLDAIYPDGGELLVETVIDAYWPGEKAPRSRPRTTASNMWSEKDSYVITYGNSLVDGEHKPLDLLCHFLETHLDGCISGVHILPYFPFTSDDGFAITDYYEVNSTLGAWEDIGRISQRFRLMSDLVINHCSSQSKMFTEYLQQHEPHDRFFFEASPQDDLSMVVRPRAHPLLREVETAAGTRHVWCTFGHDQVDFDFSNPEVLLEFLRITRFHLDRGVRTLRLDAIAFLWKEPGTSCVHLPQTHAVVRLLRLLANYSEEPLIILTETNVPNAENLSYFGNGNEAHAVYNFTLPPLLLHGLLNGTSRYLNAWLMSMPPPRRGCFYFNFTASHDGIGMRPAEGFLSESQIDELIDTVRGFGGLVSMRKMSDGSERPYEINVTLFDALKGTVNGEDQFNIERFLCSQIIAMGLEGIPAFYIHSLLATPNDLAGVEKMGYNRAINRHRWDYTRLQELLDDPASTQSRVLSEMKRLVAIRTGQPAFHPNATQFTLQLGPSLFGFWRQSMDRSQSIFAIHNLGSEPASLPSLSLNLIDGERWYDLLSPDDKVEADGIVHLAPYQCRWITNRQTA